MRHLFELLDRFRADERGVFAIIFGLMAIVLVAMAGAAVDYTSMENARNRAQIALDSAALGLAPTIYDDPTEEELIESAEALVIERLGDTSIAVEITSAVPVKDTGTLTITGSITVPMAFVQLVGISSLTANIVAQTKKGSNNVEVAVALDVTGSMAGDIEDLQAALATLIPIVVKDSQLPTYSKMALVPYSTAVKIDAAYIDDVRDPIIPAKPASSAAWWNVERNISGASKTNPIVITTSASHGYSTGDVVYISGVTGMTQLNNKMYKVGTTTSSTFQLKTLANANVNGTSGYSTYTSSSGDKVKRCILSTCEVVITADSHGFATNDRVAFSDFATYMTRLNNRSYPITNLTTNTFKLTNTTGFSNSSFNQPASGSAAGNSWCADAYGCGFYYTPSGTLVKATTDCVVERMTDSFTDEAPSASPFAIYYNVGGNCEVNQQIQPLTSVKDDLVAYTLPGGLTTGGGTAGQIGTAWAWNAISPKFAEVFTGAGAPAAYNAPNTLKFLIIMTDGEYNTEHCNGVHINYMYTECSAPDGTTGTMAGAFGQAEDLCHNMKVGTGIVVYTVGFRLGTTGNDVDILKKCASDPSKAKLAEDGAGLLNAFKEIGEDLATLRLAM